MKMKKAKLILIIAAAMLTVFVTQQALAEDLVIVSTKSTRELAQRWLSYLETQQIFYDVIEPSEFEDYKDAGYMIVYGSMDEDDDMKGILKGALSSKELEWISKEGNGNLFFKSDVWDSGQKVMVITGSSRAVAEEIRKSYRDDWFETLVDWFDLEVSEGLRAY